MRWWLIPLIAGVVAGTLPLLSDLLGTAPHRAHRPEQGRLIDIAVDRQLNVYELPGDLRPVVLVHGVPGSGRMMSALGSALADRNFPVVTYDRLGWVYSSPRPGGEMSNPTANAHDLINLLQALSIDQPILVGYSYGGGVVQEVNRLQPDLSACNVLMSSLGRGGTASSPSMAERVMYAPWLLSRVFSLTPLARRVSHGTMQALFHPATTVPDDEWLALLAELELSTDAWQRERSQRYQGFVDFQPESIHRPTLIVHGAEDAVVDVSVARALHAGIPHSQLEIVDGAGHAMVLNRVSQLTDAIVDFSPACDRT